MRDAVAALDPFVIAEERVARFGDPARIFFNVNSREDLERAEQLLAAGGRFSRALRTPRSRGARGICVTRYCARKLAASSDPPVASPAP